MKRARIITMTVVVVVSILLTAKAQAHPMWGIAVDQRGQVYFSDLKTIWRIDAQGKLSVFRAGGDRHTHDLNVDAAGNLYGADNSYDPATERFISATWMMTPAGDFSYLLSPTDNPPKGTSIWRDRDGNMYHVTHFPERDLLVLKRAPSGNVTALVGSSDAARNYRQGVPYSAGGMAFGSDGALYFVHGANVSKIKTNGALVPLARNLSVMNASENSTGGTTLLGLAVDAEGNAFVADHGNRRVLEITPAGQISTVIRAEESWFPTGVAVRGGELYILEEGHTPASRPTGTRVRKLSSDGKITVLATVEEKNVSSGNLSASASPSRGASERSAEYKQSAPYILLVAAVSVSALTLIVWCARRRTSNRSD